MEFKFYLSLLLSFLLVFRAAYGAPFWKKLENNELAINQNSKSLQFNLTLPNSNDILQINISLLLLKQSEPLLTDYEEEIEGFSTLTSSTPIIEITQPSTAPTEIIQPSTTITPLSVIDFTTEGKPFRIFTIDEAIEAFRKEIIAKESDIGGIIEAKQAFYRHFKLEYDNFNIPIRCTYDSRYSDKLLSIKCFEYREIETERILSNGDIEKVLVHDTSYKRPHVEIIDVKNYRQTYNMVIV